MALVGAFVRLDPVHARAAAEDLARLPGVSTFPLPHAPGCLGLWLETEGLDAAHELLSGRVAATPGVLGAWPSYLSIEDELPEAPCR